MVRFMHASNGAFGPSSDWLLALIAQITGEAHPGVGDELRLTEDFHLDSLGRVQLAAAIEERLGIVQGNGLLEEVQTLGELRKLVAGGTASDAEPDTTTESEVPPQVDNVLGGFRAARKVPLPAPASRRRLRRARGFSIPRGRGGNRSAGSVSRFLKRLRGLSRGSSPHRASSLPPRRCRLGHSSSWATTSPPMTALSSSTHCPARIAATSPSP